MLVVKIARRMLFGGEKTAAMDLVLVQAVKSGRPFSPCNCKIHLRSRCCCRLPHSSHRLHPESEQPLGLHCGCLPSMNHSAAVKKNTPTLDTSGYRHLESPHGSLFPDTSLSYQTTSSLFSISFSQTSLGAFSRGHRWFPVATTRKVSVASWLSVNVTTYERCSMDMRHLQS